MVVRWRRELLRISLNPASILGISFQPSLDLLFGKGVVIDRSRLRILNNALWSIDFVTMVAFSVARTHVRHVSDTVSCQTVSGDGSYGGAVSIVSEVKLNIIHVFSPAWGAIELRDTNDDTNEHLAKQILIEKSDYEDTT